MASLLNMSSSRVMGGKGGLLPSGYTQLEWIENRSSAYINTGFIYKIAPRIVTEICPYSISDLDYFGVQTNIAPSWIGDFTKNSSYYRYGPTNSYNFRGLYGNNIWVKWDLGKYCYVNNALVKTCNDYDFSTNTQKVLLFSGRGGNAYCAFKITRFYDGGTLVRHYIPCIDPNNVVGMYDLVEGKFYSSPNGVAFIAGPVVS